MDKDKKDLGKWWIWILFLVLVTVGIFTALKPAGMWWERQVFVESHQYKEARSSELAAFQAQLAQIQIQLITETDENVINNLRSQQAMLNVQIQTARAR